jgi:hypothetical protein
MFAKLATRMRCLNCGKKVAEIVAVGNPGREGVAGANENKKGTSQWLGYRPMVEGHQLN